MVALREVWLDGIERTNYIHASLQATLYNAHFKTDGVPFTAEDLLGRGDREKRMNQKRLDRAELFKFSAVMTSNDDLVPVEFIELAREQGKVN